MPGPSPAGAASCSSTLGTLLTNSFGQGSHVLNRGCRNLAFQSVIIQAAPTLLLSSDNLSSMVANSTGKWEYSWFMHHSCFSCRPMEEDSPRPSSSITPLFCVISHSALMHLITVLGLHEKGLSLDLMHTNSPKPGSASKPHALSLQNCLGGGMDGNLRLLGQIAASSWLEMT